MSANELIFAIQSCNIETLRLALEKANAQADRAVENVEPHLKKWERKNPVSERATTIDVTPLHVVAKAYSAYASDPVLSQVFDDMTQMLLEAGGNPFLEAGAVMKRARTGDRFVCEYKPGKTVVEVCNGVVPPSLKTWIAKRVEEAKVTSHDAIRYCTDAA